MKPCLMKKKRIALLVVDGLDAEEARDLREHLRTCSGCQEYSTEVAEICRDQSRAAGSLPDIDAGKTFHRRLQRRLAGEAGRPALADLGELLFRCFSRWQVALPLVVVIALTGVLLSSGRRSPRTGGAPVARNSSTGPAIDDSPYKDSLPTVSAYRSALNRSFEEFDELLNKNSARTAARSEPVIMAALGRVSPE